MEELVDEGLIRSIGVSNFTIQKVEDLLKHSPRVKPACNQVEMHPYLPQKRLMEFSQKEGIVIVAYSPLGNPGRPANFKSDDEKNLLQDDIVSSVAKKHSVPTAQVLIAYGISRETGVLVKSVTDSRIKENLNSLKVKLDTDDMLALDAINYQYRYVKQSWALKVGEEFPDLWDGEYLG